MARTGIVSKILNKINAQINPATEEKQDDTIAQILATQAELQASIQSLLEHNAYFLQFLMDNTQSLAVVDSLRRLRTVSEVSGTAVGQAVSAGRTGAINVDTPTVSTATNYFQGVYGVGQDWRLRDQAIENIPYYQMLNNISFH